MRELKKYYINSTMKEGLVKQLMDTSTYNLALDIGISVTSLRSFLLGKGLKEELYFKIVNYLEKKHER